MSDRIICWFSCGAASAFASYLTLKKYNYSPNIELVYCRVKEEHEDNLKFLQEFSKKINKEIKIIQNEKYDGSIYNVFNSVKFIKGPTGAPCTKFLKKEVRQKYQKHGDLQIFGYTIEETNRADRFIDSNNEVACSFPLIDNKITKQQCKDFITDLNITLPRMYRLGYSNNNCVGCVKGGMGYWNAIRIDFPEVFDRMAKQERKIGHSINKDQTGPIFLDELDPNRGNFKRDMPSDCGFTCEWQQQELF